MRLSAEIAVPALFAYDNFFFFFFFFFFFPHCCSTILEVICKYFISRSCYLVRKRTLECKRTAKIQISLRVCTVWPESSPSAIWMRTMTTDQTERMYRLIWVFVGCTMQEGTLPYVATHMIIIWPSANHLQLLSRLLLVWFISFDPPSSKLSQRNIYHVNACKTIENTQQLLQCFIRYFFIRTQKLSIRLYRFAGWSVP